MWTPRVKPTAGVFANTTNSKLAVLPQVVFMCLVRHQASSRDAQAPYIACTWQIMDITTCHSLVETTFY